MARAIRWWAAPVLVFILCTATAVIALFSDTPRGLTAAAFWTLAVTSVMARGAQRYAFRSGFYRARYDPRAVDAPEPWDPDPEGDRIHEQLKRMIRRDVP